MLTDLKCLYKNKILEMIYMRHKGMIRSAKLLDCRQILDLMITPTDDYGLINFKTIIMMEEIDFAVIVVWMMMSSFY